MAGAFLLCASNPPQLRSFAYILLIKSPQNLLFGRTFFKMALFITIPVARIRICPNSANNVEVSHAGVPKMSKLIMQFARDDSGATAIEYGLIAAGIAVAIIAVVLSVGSNLNTTFQEVSDNLK